MFKRNLLYATRSFQKNPGIALVIVFTLALGIGANTAIFSVVYAALLRPLPYLHPDQLFFMGEAREQLPQIDNTSTSYPDFQDWRRSSKAFQSLAAFSGDTFILGTRGEPRQTLALQVTTNFFSTLGVKPLLGRDFLDGEEQPDGPHVAILSYPAWQTDFGADPQIVGRTIRLDGTSANIVGVLPRNFEFAPGRSAPIWVPLHPADFLTARRNLRWLSTIGRLAPGVSAAQAALEMKGISAQLSAAYPKENAAMFFVMSLFRDRIVGKVGPLLLVLLAAVAFVLLIACANVANLLVTRSIGRRKEFAVRAALGASRSALLSQLLTESVVLSFVGAAIGFLGAAWGVSALVALIPESQLVAMPYLRAAGVNLPVLGFLILITVLTTLLFGVAPALTVARSSMSESLKDETRGGTSRTYARLRSSIVVVEIAVCLMLLVGGGLMLRSLHALLHHDAGFDPRNVLTFDISLPNTSYPPDKANSSTNSAADHFNLEFTRRLRGAGGATDAAFTSLVPISGNGSSIRFIVEGRPVALGQEDECSIADASSRYFSTLKVPLLAGRVFAEKDFVRDPAPVVVNQTFVRSYLPPNENPLRQRIRFTFSSKEPFRQIIGVVGDMAMSDLDSPPSAAIYTPASSDTYTSFVVRTAGDPVAFLGTARTILREMDSQVPFIRPRTIESIATEAPSVFFRRYPSILIGCFATLALVLAMVGLYGLIAYSVMQRTREIGIRVAMGAQRSDVLRLVLREGLGTAAIGLAFGILGAALLTRQMSSLLYGVTSSDASTYVVASLCLFASVLAASFLPARRATKVDPIIALRYE